MKLCACAVCSVSFQSVRRDAEAHRAGKAQLFPKAAHGGELNAVPAIEAQDATLAARIEVQAHAVADLDRRQIDSTIEEAVMRGRTNAAPLAIDCQRKARQVLAGDVKTERSTLGANGRQIEADTAPIRHVAEPIGADTDSEWAIRWLLALMVLCRDPPAIALTAAASARNGPQSDAALSKIMDDVVQVAD